MKKQNVFNKMINFEWQQQDSKRLKSKIKNIRSATNVKCPESYIYRSKLRPQSIDLREQEITRRNKILSNKICNIHESKMSKLTMLTKHPIHSMCATNKATSEKTVNIENSQFCQRMIDKKPAIDLKRFESDFNQSNYYKSIISQFPLIKLPDLSTHDKNENLNNLSSIANRSVSHNATNTSFFNKTSSSFYTNRSKPFNIARNIKDYPGVKLGKRFDISIKPTLQIFEKLFEEFMLHIDDGWDIKTILFNKTVNLRIIDCDCLIKFYIENKCLIAQLQPRGVDFDSLHFLTFEGREEVLKICKDFKSFEEVLASLEYRSGNFYLKHKTEKLKYKIKKFSMFSEQRETLEMNQGSQNDVKAIMMMKYNNNLNNTTIYEANVDQEEELQFNEMNKSYVHDIVLPERNDASILEMTKPNPNLHDQAEKMKADEIEEKIQEKLSPNQNNKKNSHLNTQNNQHNNQHTDMHMQPNSNHETKNIAVEETSLNFRDIEEKGDDYIENNFDK